MAQFLAPAQTQDGDNISFSSVHSYHPGPDTLTKLIRRLRALTLVLLPVEVVPSKINEPTSRIITPQVISAYRGAAGDFQEALPYCLLRARAEFIWDANHNPADYGENLGRAIACEVLARRVVHLTEPGKIKDIMSNRYQHRQVDGDESEMSSALELAIDQHCTIFLSSNEAQEVVNAIWRGDIIQINNENHDIEYVAYSDTRERTFFGHFHPARLSVPRYQNFFRIAVWLFFLFVYSQAVREPLEKLGGEHKGLDKWEVTLYLMSFSFFLEDVHKLYTLLRFVTWHAFSFWNFVAFATDALLLTAFVLRLIGIEASGMRLRSFQVLSFVAPLIWMKLITIFDGFKYIGTMQICVTRMMKESGIFVALLSVLAIGFAQGLYALDAADGSTDPPSSIVNVLVRALLQSPDFDKFSTTPAGLLLYYFWSAVTAIVLLNVLISLFSTAYSDIVNDAEAQYLSFFADKTIGMIRAPDSYVYPAPFNMIEAFLVAPFEFLPLVSLSEKNYARLNRWVMGVVFFIPLVLIASFESIFDRRSHTWMDHWFRGNDEGEQDSPAYRNPVVDDPQCAGLQISKIPFEELIKVFPNASVSGETTIMNEIEELTSQLKAMSQKLDRLQRIVENPTS